MAQINYMAFDKPRAIRAEEGKGGRTNNNAYWNGMNMRDETDPVFRKPIGRMIREGFELLFDGDRSDNLYER